ncbi:MAG: type II toxin-antitoxin system CcdA family antitoxin [Ghiorsea sp.]
MKKAVNLRIKQSLIDEAKALKINLSQTLETSLIKILRNKQKEAWLENNQDAITAYNQRIEKQGVFSNNLRQF